MGRRDGRTPQGRRIDGHGYGSCVSSVYPLLLDFTDFDRYRECSKYSLSEGQVEKAMGYARKELDVQVTCLGEDTSYLPANDDANTMIKHIENLSEAEKVRARMNEKRVQKEQKKMDKKAAKKAAKK